MKRLQGRKWWEKSETSRTWLGEIKQYANDDGQGCESFGNVQMLTETPGKITQKQDVCCFHKPHRGEWEELWQSSGAIRRHMPERSPAGVRNVGKAPARAELAVHAQERLWVCGERRSSFSSGSCLTMPHTRERPHHCLDSEKTLHAPPRRCIRESTLNHKR